jgi:hypothetical protein
MFSNCTLQLMGYEKVVLILYLSNVMFYEYDALEIGPLPILS